MSFTEQLPEWNAPGVEPPQSKKDAGWAASEKPPADWFNWLNFRTHRVLQELQQKSALASDVGDMSTVPTTSKTTAGAITELFQSVSDGKTKVAAAITDKGVPTSPTDAFATMAANIESIKVGIDTSDATAASGDLRAGKTAYAKGVKVTGTLPVQATGAQTVTPGTADIVKGAGIYDGDITIKGDADLVSGNIRAGVDLFGVAGKTEVVDTTEATAPAAAADILSGKVAFVNGVKRTGSMTNRGAVTITPGPTTQTIPAGYHNGSGTVPGVSVPAANVLTGTTIAGTAGTMPNRGAVNFTPGTTAQTIPAGYHNGSGLVAGDANLVAANILSGKSIFGVVGTLVPGLKSASGTTTMNGSDSSFAVGGLAISNIKIIIVERVWSGQVFRKIYFADSIVGTLNSYFYGANGVNSSGGWTVGSGSFSGFFNYTDGASASINWWAYGT